eukprot:2358221-Rhodomonas_salina.1
MSSTVRAYYDGAVLCFPLRISYALCHAPTCCPVLTKHTGLLSCYAMSGTVTVLLHTSTTRRLVLSESMRVPQGRCEGKKAEGEECAGGEECVYDCVCKVSLIFFPLRLQISSTDTAYAATRISLGACYVISSTDSARYEAGDGTKLWYRVHSGGAQVCSGAARKAADGTGHVLTFLLKTALFPESLP